MQIHCNSLTTRVFVFRTLAVCFWCIKITTKKLSHAGSFYIVSQENIPISPAYPSAIHVTLPVKL